MNEWNRNDGYDHNYSESAVGKNIGLSIKIVFAITVLVAVLVGATAAAFYIANEVHLVAGVLLGILEIGILAGLAISIEEGSLF